MIIDPKHAGSALTGTMADSMQGFAAASKTMQAVTNEMMAMSMDSLRRTTAAFQEMQQARSLTDIMRIQTDFFRGSFEEFAQRSRKIAEMAAAAGPMGMVAQVGKSVEKVGEQTHDAVTAVAEDTKAATVGLDG